MMRVKYLLAVCGLLLLTGCGSAIVDYKKPVLAAEKKSSWSGQLGGGLSSDELSSLHLANWWETLGDSQLNALVAQAIESNLDIRNSQANLRQARAQRVIADAGKLPSLQVDASVIEGGTRDGSATTYATGLDAGWELDFFGGKEMGAKAASADAEAVEEAQRDVLVMILAEVSLNYNDLRTLQKRRSVAQANLELQEETLTIVQAKAEAGAVSRVDVNLSVAAVESVRAQLPSLDQQIQQIMNRLAVLLGKPPGSLDHELVQYQPLSAPSVQLAVGVPAQVLRRRPDVRMAERKLAAETYRVGVTRAELYPKFTLSGTIGLESLSLASLFTGDGLLFGIGPGVKWNIFDGGRTRQQIEIQSAEQEKALIQYEKSVLLALEDVENAINAYAREQLRYNSLESSLKASIDAADLAKLRYEAGATDFLAVLDAQRTLLSAEEQATVSSGKIVANLIRLYKALGGGWKNEVQPSDGNLNITGTIVFKTLEGGFFAIDGDDGGQYNPLNLNESFRKNGLRVKVVAELQPEMMSMYNYGKIVEIKDIMIIDK